MHPAKPGVFYQNGGTFPCRVFITYLSYEHSIFLLQRIFVDVSEQVLRPALFCFRQIGSYISQPPLCGYRRCRWFGMGVLQDADKSVMDHNPLAAVFARAFRFIYRDMIDQFPQ